MTLHQVKLLHAFSSWASHRVFDAVAQLPENEYFHDAKSSHKSIHGTLVHMVAAEKMWLSRWVGTPDTSFVSEGDVPGLSSLRTLWENVGYDTAKFLGSMTDRKLQDTLTIKTPRGETFTLIYWQAIQHVVDHSTYHRGQVVTMLRQLGYVPPSTGLLLFYRETAKLGTA